MYVTRVDIGLDGASHEKEITKEMESGDMYGFGLRVSYLWLGRTKEGTDFSTRPHIIPNYAASIS